MKVSGLGRNRSEDKKIRLEAFQVTQKKIIVRVQGISKSFSRKKVLEGVSFALQEGKIYGLIGRNGAGKSTIMKIISGVLKADTGNVTSEVMPDKIGCMLERPVLYHDMSAKENMEIARRMYGIKNKHRADELLECVGLSNVGKKKVWQYSLGMKMRLGLAKVMLNEPEFLMLDEPLNGLDPIGTEEILHILKTMSKGKHTTILISSHMLSELEQIATDYLVLDQGRLGEVISEEDIKEMENDGEVLKERLMKNLRGE